MSNIDTYYGGSVLAMKGKGCILLGSDKRMGNNAVTIHNNISRMYVMTPRIVVSMCGFLPDGQIIAKILRKHINMFKLNQGREIEPNELCSLLSYILYGKRFSPYYADPIVIGFDRNGEGHIYSMDMIGCVSTSETYLASGTARQNIVGMAEVLFEENLEQEDLFTTGMQTLLNSVDRDALSGWGAEAIILTPTGRIHREVSGRQD
ncbi:20S proteasome subunit beta 3 [Nematocida sp. AWRm80]|nr:20S proteasome subunit beta 3 [Nematocida sp. AWRm80]